METFFRELFQYNHHVNQEIIAVLTTQPLQAAGTSIKLMSHIVNVHQVWNCRLIPGEKPYTPWDLHPVQDCYAINRKNFDNSGLVLDTLHAGHLIEYTTGAGKVCSNSVGDIMFQIINHSTYHRAQIATAFRQAGIEPLLTDYIFYKGMRM